MTCGKLNLPGTGTVRSSEKKKHLGIQVIISKKDEVNNYLQIVTFSDKDEEKNEKPLSGKLILQE